MINVVSFSGGRTSAYLVYLMEQRRKAGEDVRYIFMDTGAEHPNTYKFIRDMVRHWGIPLVCLRAKTLPTMGKGNTYTEISIDDIGNDLLPWRDMLHKYGTPYLSGAFCTDRLKLKPFKKYCDATFGRNNYITWLGIREDEPKRLTPKNGYDYLASISDFDKQDVLSWWKEQPFNLDLKEHLGNCVFCIKKGLNKIALAARDEPELADDFWKLITSDNTRQVETRSLPGVVMYREKHTLESAIALFASHSRDEILNTIRNRGGEDAGSCSESCEVFHD